MSITNRLIRKIAEKDRIAFKKHSAISRTSGLCETGFLIYSSPKAIEFWLFPPADDKERAMAGKLEIENKKSK